MSTWAKSAPPRPNVVILLASAEDPRPVQSFLRSLPPESGLAVLVLPLPGSEPPRRFAEGLGPWAALPCASAEEGEEVFADRLLVLRPGMELTQADGRLRVRTGDLRSTGVQAGDRLLATAAACLEEEAVGILLAGIGTDGTVGLRAIRARGGLALAQAGFPGAPDDAARGSHAAEAAEAVLHPEAMPAFILSRPTPGPASGAQARGELRRICELLAARTGNDFTGYKAGTLERRIHRRMQACGCRSLADYRVLLEESPEEAVVLMKEFLIRVTEFFRDPEAFQSLAAYGLPRILETGADPIRVWVPGCATGEEAYSLAILLQEHLEASRSARTLRIFATDIDAEAIQQAKAGRFPASALGHLLPEQRKRFFTEDGDSLVVAPALRDRCVFSLQNILRDPPFSSVHLISCRNLFIYLTPSIQRRLLPLLHFALKPGGVLFLGRSEGLSGHPGLFSPLDKANRIYVREDSAERPMLPIPLRPDPDPRPPGAPRTAPGSPGQPFPSAALGLFEQMLLKEYLPGSALINESGDILFWAGRIGRYLHPVPGAPSGNLLASTSGLLHRELRRLLGEVRAGRAETGRSAFTFDAGDGPERLKVTVRALPGLDREAKVHAVVIQSAGAADPDAPAPPGPEADGPILDQMVQELRAARAELQNTVEELEATNEELQSSNEELQSSQEELRAVNEDLAAANMELNLRLGELREANSDLQNLMDSTEIATVFLDMELRVSRYTPSAKVLFGFREGDLGRPIGDLAPRFTGIDLPAAAREVLLTHAASETQVRSLDGGRWFLVRLLPYQTLAQEVAGVVATFVDCTEIRQAELMATANEARYRELFHSMTNGFAHCRMRFAGGEPADFLYLVVNKAFMTQTGLPDVTGRWVSEVIPGIREQDPELFEIYGRVARGGVPERFETRVAALAQWFEISVYSPAPGEFVAVFDVITARKEAEQALRQNEERLRLFIDHAPVSLALFDPAMRYLAVSRKWLDDFGLAGQNLLGRCHYDVFPEIPEAWKEAHRKALAGEVVRAEADLFLRADGGTQWLRWEVRPWRMADGKVGGIAIFTEDITERRMTEEALRVSEERFAMAFNASPDAIMVSRNTDGALLMVNEGFTRMLGIPVEQAIGKTIPELGILDDPEGEGGWPAAGKALPGMSSRELALVGRDGRRMPGLLSTRAVDWHGAGATLSVIRDITDLAAAHERSRLLQIEVDHLQRLDSLGRLAGGVAHDMNNILGAILAVAQTLQAQGGAAGEMSETLSIIERASVRGRDLVKSLLAFGRKSMEAPRPIEINELVRQQMALMDRTLLKKYSLSTDLHAGLPAILGEAGPLGNALMNLCVNAIDAMPGGGRLTIHTRLLEDQQVEIDVEDTGVGMDAETIRRALEPFFTTKEAGKGTGLGLASAYATARAHGGTLELRSQVGQGTHALLRLPLVRPAEASDTQALPPPDAQSGRDILLVDDDELLRTAVTSLLAALGHRVEAVQDGMEALRRLARDPAPDLVILDMNMPGMNGLETLKGLRRTHPRLPVLVASGFIEPEAEAAIQADPCLLPVTKPFSMEEVQEMIRTLTAGSRP